MRMAYTCRMRGMSHHWLILICPTEIFHFSAILTSLLTHLWLILKLCLVCNLRRMEGDSRCVGHPQLAYGSGLGARCHMLCRRLMRLACCIQSGSGTPLR